jgi:hypothetical protein
VSRKKRINYRDEKQEGENTPMVNLKFKGAVVAAFGSQAAAAKTLRAAGCSGMNERRLSRLIHGFDEPRPEEVRIIRERLGVVLTPAESAR